MLTQSSTDILFIYQWAVDKQSRSISVTLLTNVDQHQCRKELDDYFPIAH